VLFAVFTPWFVIFLNFLRRYLSKFSQYIASSEMKILNMKKVEIVKAIFFQFYQNVLYRHEKTGTIDFLEKRAPSTAKYILVVRSQRTSKCGKNIRHTRLSPRVPHFLFLPHSDVICDTQRKQGNMESINLVPRVLSLPPRESTLVAAGHVSARFLQIPEIWLKGGAGKLKFASAQSLPT